MSQPCPYLGLLEDAKTSANFPSSANACHAVDPPFVVTLDYQRSRCLRETHTDCPGFVTGWEGGVPKSIRYSAATPSTKKVITSKWVWFALAGILALVLVIGFSGWIPGFSFPFRTTPEHGASVSLSKTTYTPTAENTITSTPLPTQTTTKEKTKTSTSSDRTSRSTRTSTQTETSTSTNTTTLTPSQTRVSWIRPTNTLQPTSINPPVISSPKPSSTNTNTATVTSTLTTTTNPVTTTPTATWVTPMPTNTWATLPVISTAKPTSTYTITATATFTSTATATSTFTATPTWVKPTATNTFVFPNP